MSLRESISNKLENQINEWNKKLAYEKAKAEEQHAELQNRKADAELKEDSLQVIEDLQDNIRNAQTKLMEVKDASENHLKKMKSDIESWMH